MRQTHIYWGTCNREGEISDRRESEGGRESLLLKGGSAVRSAESVVGVGDEA